MNSEAVTFADVRKRLVRLGFEVLVNDLGNKVFQYPNSDILIILPPYELTAIVPFHYLDMIRHTLDFNGIMSPAAFDGLAEKVPS
jgi:hypothetical protein